MSHFQGRQTVCSSKNLKLESFSSRSDTQIGPKQRLDDPGGTQWCLTRCFVTVSVVYQLYESFPGSPDSENCRKCENEDFSRSLEPPDRPETGHRWAHMHPTGSQEVRSVCLHGVPPIFDLSRVAGQWKGAKMLKSRF